MSIPLGAADEGKKVISGEKSRLHQRSEEMVKSVDPVVPSFLLMAMIVALAQEFMSMPVGAAEADDRVTRRGGETWVALEERGDDDI
jgi:hypothetical protein